MQHSALRQAITDGEQHLRPVLAEAQFQRYVEVGLALRAAFRTPALRDVFIDRLKPHRRLVAGTLPAGIQRHGMLPPQTPPRSLADIPDAELAQWLVDDGRLIYGEFTPLELDHYFTAVAPWLPERGQGPGHFIDLGSGLGKVVLTAALALPGMRCSGVELLGYRHEMAQARLQAMLAAGDPQEAGAIAARVQLRQQDMFEADVSDASLVYLYSTCFAPLMERLAEKLARELAPGALVSTTTVPLPHPAFELLQRFDPPSVAWTTVFLYRLRGSSAVAPAPARALYEPDGAAWEAAVRAAFAAHDAEQGA
ncbi:histone methylation protein DOT1-like protein [Pseudoduganella sp. DS3]|uniref:Histone methylation protein DOT1-like protein n=1 Tax=Pseudoduganella guangdongensis TaxID=2692179 RepID=A0A6N9HGG6_9BURK|nr:histone methylation protein DOT1-like protein [Pseudoduganella guangdongensis]MYN02634.1 histone methylation protein DOT1-like protein [Pseudoduganella guangdongensis]